LLSLSVELFAILAARDTPQQRLEHDELHHRRSSRLVEDEGGCDLCEDNWLFILSGGGRTGSTTALSMFNSVPGFELSGEHYGLLKEMEKLFQDVKLTTGQMSRGVVAFAGNRVDEDYIACSVQHLTKRIILGAQYDTLIHSAKVIGFKEIRYGSLDMLRFLHRIFPCARYIFSYRDETDAPVRTAAFDQKKLLDRWEQASGLFHRVHAKLNSTTSLLALEQLSVEHYNRVLRDKLGVQGCEFSAVVHDNADGGFRPDQSVSSPLSGECDLSAVSFRLSPGEVTAAAAALQDLERENNATAAPM